MKTVLKGFLEKLLLRGGPAAVARRRLAGRSLVLAYHNVVPDDVSGRGDASLHLRLSSFRAQLDALAELAEVVTLPELLAGEDAAGSSGARPRVSITFDDAYAGAVTLALPEIVDRGMSATVFVSPGRLDGEVFWWDSYAGAHADAAPADFRELALAEMRGVETEVRDWAAETGLVADRLPPPMRTVDEAVLRDAARLTGVTLASHSWSHPNLTRLADKELGEELSRSLEWLRDRFPGAPGWIAYPYGLTDARVAGAARQLGYDVGFRVAGGWLPRPLDDPLMLPRLNIPAGLSDAGFRLRLSGLL